MGAVVSCCVSQEGDATSSRSGAASGTAEVPHTVVSGAGLQSLLPSLEHSSFLRRTGCAMLGTSSPMLQTVVTQQPQTASTTGGRRYRASRNNSDADSAVDVGDGGPACDASSNVLSGRGCEEDDATATEAGAVADASTSTTGSLVSQRVNPIFAATVDSLTLLEKQLQQQTLHTQSHSTDARTGGCSFTTDRQLQRETCDEFVSSPSCTSSLNSNPSPHAGCMNFLSFRPM